MPYDQKELMQMELRNMENDADLGAVALPQITTQERHYVAARVSGLAMNPAAREVGIHVNTAKKWEKREEIRLHMQHYQEEYTKQVLPRIRFGKEEAHVMYMNAYHSAGTSAEMTRATDSLVKLHRLLEKDEEGNETLPTSARQLEGLSTQQLLRYASIGLDTLRPGEVHEADWEDVDD